MWTYDTTVYSWRLNLIAPPNGVSAYIRYGVNMQGITRIVTRQTFAQGFKALGTAKG